MKLKHREEQFQDQIARLFPELNDNFKAKEKERALKNNDACDLDMNHKTLLARPVTFQVTDGCNLRCKYCYQINKSNHKMPFDVAKRFIDMLLSYKTPDDNKYINLENTPGISIEFIGGEPFLEIDLMDQITDYFIAQMIKLNHPWLTKYMISICSNGLLYSDPKVQKYLIKHRRHLSFSISIDGNKELHDSARVLPDGVTGSYDIAMAGVKDWVSRGNIMGSKITLSPFNITKTFEAVESIIQNGYDDININCVYEEGWTTEHAKILYEQLKKLADYMIDNNLPETVRVAMFEQNFFHPKMENDIQNWCWGKGTPILTDKGYKSIEEIKVGDMVLTHTGHYKPVIDLKQHFATNVIKVKVLNKEYTVTDNHKLFTENFDKIEISKISDTEILTVASIDNNYMLPKTTQLEILGKVEDQEVYNITVAEDHSYIAGDLVSSNCGGNAAMISVDWRGDIYPCIRYMESSLGTDQKPLIVGNVYEGLVTKPEWEQIMEDMRNVDRKTQSTDECFNCPIAEGCSWCSAYNYQMFGTLNHRATYICIMHKARALANLYFWNKWFLKTGEHSYMKRYLPDKDSLEIISQEELDMLDSMQKQLEKDGTCLNLDPHETARVWGN